MSQRSVNNAPLRWPIALAGFLLGFLGLFWWQKRQDDLLREAMDEQQAGRDD